MVDAVSDEVVVDELDIGNDDENPEHSMMMVPVMFL